MPLLGAAAWGGALVGLLAPAAAVVAVVVLAATALVACGTGRPARGRRRDLPGGPWVVAGCLLVFGVVAVSAVLRVSALEHGPVADLAADRAVVEVELTVTGDPRRATGEYGDVVVVRARVEEIAGRGRAWVTRAPVVVLADDAWGDLRLGQRVAATGRLSEGEGDVAGLLSASGSPEPLARPDVWWRAAAAVRASIRGAVAPRGEHERELVPALVVGDDSGLATELADDFRTTGLTHLLAVSGTNLTLLVGALLVAGRWVGVRGRWTWGLAGAGIVGFVLLARTEPSVVRAATMGTVALVAMGSNGRERGSRSLGVAVLALLLVAPHLATTPGFALSVLATGGILLLAPAWRDALARWLPRWAAEAVSIPAAAQVACTPVVTALSGEVSLVAVAANLLAAPAVAPATVLGLAGGVVGLLWAPLGQVVAAPAAWSVRWIIEVAQHGAALPTAAVSWGTGPGALVLVTVLCVLLVLVAPRLLGSPVGSVGCALVLVLVVVGRPPSPGWPPDGWVLVMCDVAQGDGLVLRAAAGAGVVVDAGPEPAAVDGCLHRLGVERVPLVVLTHPHADHVDGLPGVVSGRDVGRVEVSAATGSAPRGAIRAPYGVSRRVGDVAVQVVWPEPGAAVAAEEDLNDASVVLLAEVGGVRMLLTGDVEPPAQARLATALAGVRVDVLKVPHHGSRHQDLDFLLGLRPRLALVSVGADNDYGHPASGLLQAFAGAGVEVRRTDVDGDVAVVVRDGAPAVVGRG
jgi:competence protein ComEC